ncbi:MAG: PilZ domain-containing protein [Hyalangium sp.]|uniref:PilZ domain-containing protein n=1 Tax=Hyalangium sp. TaxID=2028555 RepID=UPI00389A98DD
MSGPDRRRHTRYKVRISIQFLRGEVEVVGEIFNISRSGCLLVTPVSLRMGERVEVYVRELGRPPEAFRVVRTRSLGAWNAVSVEFEPHLPDDTVLARLASQDEASEDPEQIF